MRSLPLAAALLALLLGSCGAPPAQVGGTYTGHHNLMVIAGEGESGSQVLTVTQQGGEIHFTLGLCPVKALADSASSFRVEGFQCSKLIGSQSWQLTGEAGKSTVTSNANSFSVAVNGQARNGAVETSFSWGFSGSKSF